MNTELSKAETKRIVKPFSDDKFHLRQSSETVAACLDNLELRMQDLELQPRTIEVRHTYPSPYFLAGIALGSAFIGGLAAWLVLWLMGKG